MNRTLTFLLLSTALLGCDIKLLNFNINAYCDEMVDCRDGNDADLKACKVSIANERELAAAYDCSDDYADFLECAIDEGDCEEDDQGRDYWEVPGCGDEYEDYYDCIDDESDYD